MAIKIEMLRCFCTVAQTGNLVEAADRLGRTQSAVSMTLKQLEEHLGKKLFEGERKNQLSPLGEGVFDLALRQVRQFDQAVQNIEAAAQAERGLIRIVSVPSVGALIFPPLLDYMMREFPGVKIELRDTHTQQVLDSIAEDQADIGIASGYHPLNGVRTIPMFQDSFGLVAASDHPLITRSEPLTIADILTAPFVRNALCDLIQAPAFLPAIENAEITIHNTHSLITMVRTGEWITVLPQTVAGYLPEAVSFRPISDLHDKRQVYLYIRERSRFQDLTDQCSAFILSCDFA
ncbi:transcriptional regulator, LysR family [Ruegeria halocynthiae]|uniref:Transcriptional regulator, LysR family n=1 Tax=Ruegeria halocynthiae TaxID=985054 RepID=A0A1H3CLL4_9RHOB|nr:LysR family transcriptional regulator [Ruegeria halocynthiae]SDX54798.1 transcriptional regulator, LysR family [Ruegeria halocynthiae]